jgi:hypothetical protein
MYLIRYGLGDIKMEGKIDLDEFWNRLVKELSDETVILNWTACHGFYGDNFRAIYNEIGFIECDVPGAEKIQRVTKKTIGKIYPYWEGYSTKKMARKHFIEKSRHTKYSISLLHQFEHLMIK